MAAAQALDFRDFGVGRGTKAAHAAVRSVVDFLDEDRPLFPDHNAMSAAVKEGVVLEAVEEEVGALESSWEGPKRENNR
jgi:histidine ammonia-lyase